MSFLDTYELEYEPGWDAFFSKLDKTIQIRIYKKILQLKGPVRGRHLQHGLPYFVAEVGGYRIAFSSNEKAGKRMIYFAGSHKDYERWYKNI